MLSGLPGPATSLKTGISTSQQTGLPGPVTLQQTGATTSLPLQTSLTGTTSTSLTGLSRPATTTQTSLSGTATSIGLPGPTTSLQPGTTALGLAGLPKLTTAPTTSQQLGGGLQSQLTQLAQATTGTVGAGVSTGVGLTGTASLAGTTQPTTTSAVKGLGGVEPVMGKCIPAVLYHTCSIGTVTIQNVQLLSRSPKSDIILLVLHDKNQMLVIE